MATTKLMFFLMVAIFCSTVNGKQPPLALNPKDPTVISLCLPAILTGKLNAEIELKYVRLTEVEYTEKGHFVLAFFTEDGSGTLDVYKVQLKITGEFEKIKSPTQNKDPPPPQSTHTTRDGNFDSIQGYSNQFDPFGANQIRPVKETKQIRFSPLKEQIK